MSDKLQFRTLPTAFKIEAVERVQAGDTGISVTLLDCTP
jgi:hypothetical protein